MTDDCGSTETVAQGALLTREDAVAAIRAHFISNKNEPAIRKLTGTAECRYRLHGVRRCAVGVLIPDVVWTNHELTNRSSIREVAAALLQAEVLYADYPCDLEADVEEWYRFLAGVRAAHDNCALRYLDHADPERFRNELALCLDVLEETRMLTE